MRKIRCCYQCNDREIGCHATCEKYIKEQEAHLEEKHRVMRGYAKDRIVENTLISNKGKIKKLSRK